MFNEYKFSRFEPASVKKKTFEEYFRDISEIFKRKANSSKNSPNSNPFASKNIQIDLNNIIGRITGKTPNKSIGMLPPVGQTSFTPKKSKEERIAENNSKNKEKLKSSQTPYITPEGKKRNSIPSNKKGGYYISDDSKTLGSTANKMTSKEFLDSIKGKTTTNIFSKSTFKFIGKF